MQPIHSAESFDSYTIKYDARWNSDEQRVFSMHSIHAYPAKFPPLIAREAFEYAKEENVNINSVADIFCGCGTVALESKIRNIPFWGCDINPVAVLITRAKINDYSISVLSHYFDEILNQYMFYQVSLKKDLFFDSANERLKYWFWEDEYFDLYCLKQAILLVVKESKYRDCFLCLFSSILKQSSKWLQKSIKPQVDPNKGHHNVWLLFKQHYNKFLYAVEEISEMDDNNCSTIIEEGNFLDKDIKEGTDLLITSPPYVTSYEYADLHQLSSLWLGYADDYRKLRKGSIGSTHYTDDIEINVLGLNKTGSSIVNELEYVKLQTARVKAIARYYSDMEKTVKKSYQMLNPNGMALFVIGDSSVKGVELQNTKHLIDAMIHHGFEDIKVGKRTIEKSLCVPYRDEAGRFSRQNNAKSEVYREEFIVSGRKS